MHKGSDKASVLEGRLEVSRIEGCLPEYLQEKSKSFTLSLKGGDEWKYSIGCESKAPQKMARAYLKEIAHAK